MNIMERNNVTIRGNGRQTMMFAHGYGCDQKDWRLVAPAFENDYEVILFDHVGSGLSDTSMYNLTKYSTLHGYADDIIQITERLEIEQGIFVGHSVGAMIGLLAAIKNPKLFERLVFIAPSPCYFNEGDYNGGFSYQDICKMLKYLDHNYESWAKDLAPMIMGNSDRPELAKELAECFCRNKHEIARHFAHVAFLSDHRRDLPKLHVPSLILQCSDDKIAPENVGRYLHEALKDSELRILNATGHYPHLSAPEETIEAIFQYLQQPMKIIS